MNILYGTKNKTINVTDICLEKLTNNNIITIPSGDLERAQYFTDPIINVLKQIFIVSYGVAVPYDYDKTIKINIITNEITVTTDLDIFNKTIATQNQLQLRHGRFCDEFPEQKMAVRYLTGNEKVLEIGGNIGRNSLIIAHILENSSNFVTLESDPDIAIQLKENRDINNFNFHIENSALSKRPLIQKHWNTIVSDVLLDGYRWINTITLDELNAKYNIAFDTLVLDCEGAFYYILLDMPEILNNINLIIMENDYNDITHKQYIDSVLSANNFTVDYVEGNGWGPCSNNFYEVWKRQ